MVSQLHMSTSFPHFIFGKIVQEQLVFEFISCSCHNIKILGILFQYKSNMRNACKKSDISIEHMKLKQIVLTSFCRLCLDSLKCVIDVCVTLYFVHFYLFPLHFRFLSAQNKRAAFEFVVSLNITSSTTRPIYNERKNKLYHSAAKTSIL